MVDLKSFSDQRSDSASKLSSSKSSNILGFFPHLVVLRILFETITFGQQITFKTLRGHSNRQNTRRVLGHLHAGENWELGGHLKGTTTPGHLTR